jgi:hypothetical protein
VYVCIYVFIRVQSAARGSVLVRHSATRREALPATLGPEVHSASNRNQHRIMFVGSRARPVHRADNFAAIYEPIF